MWEFLSRKKETPPVAVEPVTASEKPESAPVVEQRTEQATEQVNEKYAVILSQAGMQATSGVPQDIEIDAKQVGEAIDAESRVNQLIELAQVKGVAHAVQVARRLNDLYVLDTMHDELADKFYDALKQKGLLSGE